MDILGILIIDEAMSAFDAALMLSHFGITLFALGSQPTVVGIMQRPSPENLTTGVSLFASGASRVERPRIRNIDAGQGLR